MGPKVDRMTVVRVISRDIPEAGFIRIFLLHKHYNNIISILYNIIKFFKNYYFSFFILYL